MAAYPTTTTLARSASALAAPALSASATTPVRKRSYISLAPSPSLLPSPSLVFGSPTTTTTARRPNKAELEARLAGAHIRASSRRMRDALGHGKAPSTTTSTTPARTLRAAAAAFHPKSGGAPSTTTTTTSSIIYSTPTFPASPLSQVAYPGATGAGHFQSAPSPSMLPPPPATPRPLFPRRISRGPVRPALRGLGLGLSFLVETDAPLTPHHVYPETLRRTPGAPIRAERVEGPPASYFYLPADIISPQLPAGSSMGQSVGLGIMGVDL